MKSSKLLRFANTKKEINEVGPAPAIKVVKTKIVKPSLTSEVVNSLNSELNAVRTELNSTIALISQQRIDPSVLDKPKFLSGCHELLKRSSSILKLIKDAADKTAAASVKK